MPSTSDKQRKFMAAAANNPKFAAEAGIPQSVASEFHNADQGALHMATGGKSNVGNWKSRKHKDLRIYDLMTGNDPRGKKGRIGKNERQRRQREL